MGRFTDITHSQNSTRRWLFWLEIGKVVVQANGQFSEVSIWGLDLAKLQYSYSEAKPRQDIDF